MSLSSPKKNSIFHNKVLRLIILSNLLLQVGIWVRNYSILFFVMEQTGGDPYAIALISMAQYVPIFVFSFVGGTFADRWRPKQTVICCDLLSSLSVFAVLLAILNGSWQAVFLTTLVSAITAQFSQPAVAKLMKSHATEEQLKTGISFNQGVVAFFSVIGPVLGTFVYQKTGVYCGIGGMGAVFLMSAGLLTFLPPDGPVVREEGEASVLKEMAAGLRYVWSSKTLALLGICFFVAGLALGLIQPLGIFLVTERLGLPKEYVQWFTSANGLATMLGGALLLLFGKKMTPQKLLLMGLGVSDLSLVAAGLSTDFRVTLAAQFSGGFMFPFIQSAISTMMLQNTEQSFVGRVNGILSPLLLGSMLLTMSIAPWLKEVSSIVVVYQLAAVLLAVGAVSVLPLLRPYRQKSATETVNR